MTELLQYAFNTYGSIDQYNELFDACVAETLSTTAEIDKWVVDNG